MCVCEGEVEFVFQSKRQGVLSVCFASIVRSLVLPDFDLPCQLAKKNRPENEP